MSNWIIFFFYFWDIQKIVNAKGKHDFTSSWIFWCSEVGPSWKVLTEAVIQRFSVKEVFLKISQISQENTCVRASFW